jgi:hypothetical protein
VNDVEGATLSIGTFARRSRLSPKALRIYDRLGVLAPAAVDDHNGYRTYRESQLDTARLVCRCGAWTCRWPSSPRSWPRPKSSGRG